MKEKLKKLLEPQRFLRKKDIEKLLNDKDLDYIFKYCVDIMNDVDNSGIPYLLSQFRRADSEIAKGTLSKNNLIYSIKNCRTDYIPDLFQEIILYDKEKAKEIIPEAFGHCHESSLPELLKQIKEIDPELAKKLVPEAFKRFELKTYEGIAYKLLKQTREIDPENAKDYIDKAFQKSLECGHMPEIMEQIRLIDNEKAKNFMKKSLEECDRIYIYKLMEQFTKIDPELAKNHIKEAFERCRDDYVPYLMEEVLKIDPENIRNYLTEDALNASIKSCTKGKIPEIVEQLEQKDPELAKDYILKTFIQDTNISSLLKEDNEITFENMKNYVTKDFVNKSILDANKWYVPSIVRQIRLIDPENTNNYFNKDFVTNCVDKCAERYLPLAINQFISVKNFDFNIISDLIKDNKLEISDIPKESISDAKFIKTLIINHTEKIDDIEIICTKKALEIPEINNLVTKIKEANTENTKIEKNAQEIKPKQKENTPETNGFSI